MEEEEADSQDEVGRVEAVLGKFIELLAPNSRAEKDNFECCSLWTELSVGSKMTCVLKHAPNEKARLPPPAKISASPMQATACLHSITLGMFATVTRDQVMVATSSKHKLVHSNHSTPQPPDTHKKRSPAKWDRPINRGR